MTVNLAPYQVLRHIDGVEVQWFVIDTRICLLQSISNVKAMFECREDATHECSRRNSAYAMDKLGIY